MNPTRQKLSQEQIAKLLEGHQNVLAPLAAKEDEFLKRCNCPNCGKGDLTKKVNSRRPFTSGSPLPNVLLCCKDCDLEFDPYTKFITSAPASILKSE